MSEPCSLSKLFRETSKDVTLLEDFSFIKPHISFQETWLAIFRRWVFGFFGVGFLVGWVFGGFVGFCYLFGWGFLRCVDKSQFYFRPIGTILGNLQILLCIMENVG